MTNLTDFLIFNPNKDVIEIWEDLYKFKQAIKNGKAIGIFDFDGTLTDLQTNPCQWRAVCQVLPEDIQEIIMEMEKYFQNLDKKGYLDQARQKEWITRQIQYYINNELNKTQIHTAVQSVEIRLSIKKLIEKIGDVKETKIAIISFGIFDFIKDFCLVNGIDRIAKKIYGVKLLFDDETVLGFDENSITLWSSKNIQKDVFCKNLPEDSIISVWGDSPSDHSMMLGESTNFMITNEKLSWQNLPNLDICVLPEHLDVLIEFLLA